MTDDFAFIRLHSTILKRWDGIAIPFFSARSCASVCLVFTESNNCDSVFFGSRDDIHHQSFRPPLRNLFTYVFYNQFIINSFQIVITWKRLSRFCVMFEFRIWDWIPCFRAAQFRYGLLDKEKNAVGVTIANNNFIYSFLQLPRKRSAVIWLLRKVNNVTVVTNKILHAPGMTNVVKVAMGLGTLSQETVSFCQEEHAGWSLFSGRQYTRDVLWIFQKAKKKTLQKPIQLFTAMISIYLFCNVWPDLANSTKIFCFKN